jgi:hypothetical protein
VLVLVAALLTAAAAARAPAAPRAETARVARGAAPDRVPRVAPAPDDPPYRRRAVVVDAPLPAAIDIPRIGVHAALVPTGLSADGSLAPPPDFATASWYTGAPKPGETGPAIVLGHVDSRRGPAVFFRLRELVPGDTIAVGRADGSSVAFVVQRVVQAPKRVFPTGDVFAATPDPELRLVTCGGDFDGRLRSYVDNVIVFATRAGSE